MGYGNSRLCPSSLHIAQRRFLFFRVAASFARSWGVFIRRVDFALLLELEAFAPFALTGVVDLPAWVVVCTWPGTGGSGAVDLPAWVVCSWPGPWAPISSWGGITSTLSAPARGGGNVRLLNEVLARSWASEIELSTSCDGAILSVLSQRWTMILKHILTTCYCVGACHRLRARVEQQLPVVRWKQQQEWLQEFEPC